MNPLPRSSDPRMAKKPLTVEQYVAARNAPVRATLEALRKLLKATLPEATEEMKWGGPALIGADGQALVYLYGGKDHVNLGFLRAAELDDPANLLEGSAKPSKHIKIRSREEIPEKEIRALLLQSAKL